MMENNQQPTFNTEHPAGSNSGIHWLLGVRCWLLDVPKSAGRIFL
jgi:hypothetical protein